MFGLTSLNLRFGTEYETFQSDKTRRGYSNQVSTIVQGFVLSNKLNWDITETAGSEAETANGEFFFRKRLNDPFSDEGHDILLRTNFNYTIEPEATLDSYTATAEKNISDSTRARLSLAQSFGDAERTTYGLGLNYAHDYFLAGLNSSYDSEGDMAIGLNFRFNVGPNYEDGGLEFIENERAQRGSVEASVYLDNNNNSKFDEGDEPLEDVALKSRFGAKGQTNSSGKAYLHGFSGYRTDDISIDYTTLPDIFYVPKSDGFRVVPRPGNTAQLDFPVVVGGEIDGQITLTSDQLNRTYDFSIFALELVDGEGNLVKKVQADQTGYYIFERIIPAEYTLRISEESIAAAEYTGQTETPIAFDPDDPVLTGTDFNGTLAVEAEMAAAEAAKLAAKNAETPIDQTTELEKLEAAESVEDIKSEIEEIEEAEEAEETQEEIMEQIEAEEDEPVDTRPVIKIYVEPSA